MILFIFPPINQLHFFWVSFLFSCTLTAWHMQIIKGGPGSPAGAGPDQLRCVATAAEAMEMCIDAGLLVFGAAQALMAVAPR
jgi:hypothetical protein